MVDEATIVDNSVTTKIFAEKSKGFDMDILDDTKFEKIKAIYGKE